MPYKLMLKELRGLSGLKQNEVAERAGIPLSTYRTWEQGVAKKISLEAACSICEVLNCTPNDLCGWYIDHPNDRPAHAAPPPLTNDEAELVESYRALTPNRKRVISEQVEDAAARSKEQEESFASFEEGAA